MLLYQITTHLVALKTINVLSYSSISFKFFKGLTRLKPRHDQAMFLSGGPGWGYASFL